MSSCCSDTSCDVATAVVSDVCKRCGEKGVSVDPITLKALFTADALRRGIPKNPRFCATEECPVVYFDNAESSTFTEDEVTVRVHAKHPHDATVLVCYCFEHSPATIRDEIERTASSTASKSITTEVKTGHCACEVRNPKGACCLGDVARVEREVKAWLEERERSSAKSI